MTRKTNVEFVTDMMEHSPFGAIAQIVVIQAIDAYTKQIAAVPIEELRTTMPALISADAWHGACVDMQERIKKQYEG